MQKISKATLAFTAVLCLLFTIQLASAEVRPLTFSNGSLKGSYAVLLEKWRSSSSSNPEGLVGVFSFDGAGDVTISSFTANKGGTITTGTGSGTYSVAGNGTGSITVSLSNGDQGTLSIVLDAAGKGFQMILTNCSGGCGTDVISGTAVAMGGSSFSNASLKGPFEFLTTRWTTSQDSNAHTSVGILTFNGVGKVKASVTTDDAGTVKTIKATGTYSVNSDGSGSLALQGTSGSASFAFAIDSAGKGAQLLKTSVSGDGTTVDTGTATHQ